mmetsp:Transcript_16335/g.24540  ORF Transcript_16335/g.24540 Transcript_16335/m.24540 type:complete len:567 (-) Transcript_16335:244-1944(-)
MPTTRVETTELNDGRRSTNSEEIDDDNDDDDDDDSISSYLDPSTNDLTTWPGAALLVADCMGTGILALPNDLKLLGIFGFFFLVINLPINYYAGCILNNAAIFVENRMNGLHTLDDSDDNDNDNDESDVNRGLVAVAENENSATSDSDWNYENEEESTETSQIRQKTTVANDHHEHSHHGINTEHTFDFIGITYSLFDAYPQEGTNSTRSSGGRKKNQESAGAGKITLLVCAVYYTNIFLVLGNYILVMTHAVAALIGEDNICLPTAGIISSVLMFSISQLRTMSMLGRTASIISLLALAVVVVLALVAIKLDHKSFSYVEDEEQETYESENIYTPSASFWQLLMRQFAAISSIGFAVGSQKLFLNIRHEFKDRREAPRSLGIALTSFGAIYIIVCILAGPDPPSLLFDAISSGVQRRLAGLLLWIHVAVSYAINSQALCSSLDRLQFHRVTVGRLHERHKIRWAVLTFLVSISSYFIANAVPFFKDLVSLIGALTSVPLTLLLPALYYRKVKGLPLCGWVSSGDENFASLSLIIFSLTFLIVGLVGSISSIELDWLNHGAPFACH